MSSYTNESLADLERKAYMEGNSLALELYNRRNKLTDKDVQEVLDVDTDQLRCGLFDSDEFTELRKELVALSKKLRGGNKQALLEIISNFEDTVAECNQNAEYSNEAIRDIEVKLATVNRLID